MTSDINKDELEDLKKQNRGFENRIKKSEGEVGELSNEMKKLNATQETMLEVIILSNKSVLGDKKAAKELDELLKTHRTKKENKEESIC